MSDYGINIGSRRSRNVITPTFSRDFVTNKTLNHGVGPDITFTRASSATFFTSTGILSTVSSNVPRFDHSNFRTNYIRNSNATGAVNGIIGQGSTLPTFWNASGHNIRALSATVVGTGTENNIPYLDLRVFGTPNDNGSAFINADISTAIPAMSGQIWTMSSYVKLAGGSLANLTNIRTSIYGRDPNSANVIGQIGTVGITPTTASLDTQRASCTFTFSSSSVTGILPVPVQFTYSLNNPIDVTFRIGGPQLELSSAATAFIPSTNAPATTGESFGLLIEQSRTNSIRNSQAINAVVGSPGTAPSSWIISTSNVTGISSQIVETGIQNGFNYIDIRFNGVGTGTGGQFAVNFEESTRVTAASGQTWTASAYIARIGGSLTNINKLEIDLVERSAAGTYLAGTQVSVASANSTLQRFYTTKLFGEPTTQRTTHRIVGSLTTNPTIDITLRVAAPQLEQSSFPTSYIPTTTLSATRQADVAQITPVTSFVNQTQGTLFSEFRRGPGQPVSAAFVLDADDIANRVGIFASGAIQVAINGIYTSFAGFNPFSNTIFKAILGYKAFDHAGSIDGKPIQSNTAVGMPINLSHLRIGCEGGLGYTGGHLSGHVRKITYWPTKLSNNRLRLITS